MTLLSIREQEAVKDALFGLACDLDALRRAYESDYPDRLACIERCKAEVKKSEAQVLRATRDAIARQVREKHEEGASLWFDTCATFIEEMPL